MQTRLFRSITLLVAVLLLQAALLPALKAQTPVPQAQDAATKPSPAFDPHDLSGVWDFFITGVPGQGIYATPSKEPPPLTPWGQKRYDAAQPGYGPKGQTGGNDPILQCDPSGMPRVLFFPVAHEIVQTPDRMFMFFEREHAWRQIWTDGREHPQNLEPTYMGDSIGWWEGDTFVVDTVGFNDKTWLDAYGNPHSDELHIIERYKRIDRITLAMQLIIDDPKAYTKTWVGDTKFYKLLPPDQAVVQELFCVHSEEEAFTKRIRMPAAGKPPKK
jgi:hypothetical protein